MEGKEGKNSKPCPGASAVISFAPAQQLWPVWAHPPACGEGSACPLDQQHPGNDKLMSGAVWRACVGPRAPLIRAEEGAELFIHPELH